VGLGLERCALLRKVNVNNYKRVLLTRNLQLLLHWGLP